MMGGGLGLRPGGLLVNISQIVEGQTCFIPSRGIRRVFVMGHALVESGKWEGNGVFCKKFLKYPDSPPIQNSKVSVVY